MNVMLESLAVAGPRDQNVSEIRAYLSAHVRRDFLPSKTFRQSGGRSSKREWGTRHTTCFIATDRSYSRSDSCLDMDVCATNIITRDHLIHPSLASIRGTKCVKRPTRVQTARTLNFFHPRLPGTRARTAIETGMRKVALRSDYASSYHAIVPKIGLPREKRKNAWMYGLQIV